jgi:tetratricopeptide (TPR) repeat protein
VRLSFRGLTVRVHPSYGFALLIVLGALGRGELWDLPLLCAQLTLVVLSRELGIAMAWRSSGLHPRTLLFWMGGETTATVTQAIPLGRCVVNLLAGPAATLALGALAQSAGFARLAFLAYGWGGLSLLPIQPLVGGRIVATLLTPILPRTARTMSYVLSLPIAAAALVGLVSVNAPPLAMLIVAVAIPVNLSLMAEERRRHRDAALGEQRNQMARALYDGDLERASGLLAELQRDARAVQTRAELRRVELWLHLQRGEIDQAEGLLQLFPAGYEAGSALEGTIELRRGRFARAARLLEDAQRESPSDENAALLACALLKLERLEEATRLLEEPTAGPLLFRQLMAALFYQERFLEAARVGERSWSLKEDSLTAFNLACTRARLGEPEVAMAWLQRALDVGWRDLKQLDEDADLAPLRARPDWGPLRARLTSLGRVG